VRIRALTLKAPESPRGVNPQVCRVAIRRYVGPNSTVAHNIVRQRAKSTQTVPRWLADVSTLNGSELLRSSDCWPKCKPHSREVSRTPWQICANTAAVVLISESV
jgi:hypothetical protein